ncbi:CLUMA_CG020838, isoform A [Clunio marinus]|uniref:CLUMA_CG020838, isoform A n=1 Tax=Clunio marinus TaxID=568069 RepID=A0A1J1J8G8_9DIPT|nr:CLUMA_CG020838, isoform A [Clunio marinus]
MTNTEWFNFSYLKNCKTPTCFSSNKTPLLAPTPGQQYVYDFESIAIAQLINKDSVETSVAIKGQAFVTANNNCGYILVLKGLNAFGADNSKISIQKDFQYPVQFTLSGDELAPEICAEENDGTFSLNVKRGVISAFQVGQGKVSFDIFGKCPISTSTSKSGGVTTVTSLRDLNECAYREKLSNGLIQGITLDSSEIKSSPIINGKVESDAKFQNGVLESIELKESYNFMPFSTQKHGAKAKVITKMNLKKKVAGQGPAIKSPALRTLLFEATNSNMANPKVSIKDSIKAAFEKTLAEFTGQEGVISSKSAATFADIIRLMRLGKKADLLTAYQEMKSGKLSKLQSSSHMKEISRNVFLDALFRTGTGDSVAALADLAKKELSEKELKLMYLSFNLVQHVTTDSRKDAINGLAKLFNENLPKEAYLSVGNVINKFCRERGCEDRDVKIIADKFIAKIPKDCKASNKKEEEHLVAVLKGIRNSQMILNTALDRIVQCASNRNPNRVRVAALQAFPANPCNKKLQKAATTVMKNLDEDSEVRIEAYLAAMECPSGSLANDVQALLDAGGDSEPVIQVGSFINTHLDSIKASTDPKREATRAHFKNLRTSKKYPFDPRRYSFNREISYAIDSLGLGSAVDASVIYSQQSFLPRSGRLNVTGNLFGSAFNMLEISARQENVEELLEHYFGPRGVVNTMSKQDLYDAITKEVSTLNRQKRALPADLAAFDKNVKNPVEYDRDPDIDLSVKVFGSELYFLSISKNIPSTPNDVFKLFASEISKGVDALKNFQYNFENHALWLDAEITYPTAFGLPFRLTSTGSSAVKVDVSGSFDVKELIENPLNSKVQLQLNPAANIFVSGQLGFGSYAYETALEVSGTVYTNTGANTTVEMKGGKNLVISTIPTVKEQYVIDLTHQISTVSQESGREVIKVPVKFKSAQDRITELCFDQVEFLTGFTFCTSINYTPMNVTQNAPWPLYGNNHISVKLEMVDALKFSAEFDDKDPSKPGINFYYDTPKGGIQRQTFFKLFSSLKSEHFMGGVDLFVPVRDDFIFKFDSALGVLNEENEKKVYLNGNYLDENFKYELGFKRKENVIEPILNINTDISYLEGRILEEKTANGVKYTLRQVKFGRDSTTTTVDGSVEMNGPNILTNLRFQRGGNTVNLSGTLSYQPGQFNSDLQLTSPQYEKANGKFTYGVTFTDKNVANDLVIVWDKNLKSETNRFEWNQFADWSNKELFKMKNGIKIGKFNTEGRLNGDFGKKIINVDAGLEYSNQKAEFILNNKYSQKMPHDYDTSVYAAANQKSIKLDMKRDIEGEASMVENKLELSTGLKVELNGKIGHRFEVTNADVSIQGSFTPGQKKEATKITILIKNTDKEHSASSKVKVAKKEFASFESKLTYGNNMVGSMKASVTDVIEADGTFQSTAGKGNAVINASVKDKRVKAASKFTIQKPTYNFETDIYYDDAKKVYFSTKNNVDTKSFDSKNEVEVFSERYSFDVAASNDGTFVNGRQTGSVNVGLPTGRKLSVEGEREVSMKNNKGNGNFHVTATDELPNKQQRQAILDMKMSDFSPAAGFFDFTGSLKYRGYNNKDAKFQLGVKNLKKGHFSTASGLLQVDGTLVPEVVTFNIKIEEYCPNHAIYSFNGKYGQLGDIDVNGKYYVATKERPHSHDFNGALNIPKTKLQRVTLSSNGQLTEPATPDGTYIVKYFGSVDAGGDKFQFDTDMKMSPTKGSGTAKIQLPNINSISGEVSFGCNHVDKGEGSLTVKYGDNKEFKTTFNAQMEKADSLKIDIGMSGDLESFKEISFHMNALKPSINEIVANVNLKADSNAYNLDYEHRVSEKNPKFKVVWTCPRGTSKIVADANIESQLKGKGNLVIENVESFDLTSNVDADMSSLEKFYLNGEIDSPALGLKHFKFDIKSKNDDPHRSGFEFHVSKDGSHLASGSSDFTTKVEKGRTVIEGKSTIKLTDGKSDEVSFKLIRTIFDGNRDKETGFGGILNVFIGKRTHAGEFKLTDKEFHVKYTGCEPQNRCTNLETKSKIDTASIDGFKHNLFITVDLREVGFSHEFGLKADTSRDGWKFLHSVDAHLQTKDNKEPEYQYSVTITPNKAEALFSMPTRQVALDSSYKYPGRSPFGAYDAVVAFYLDKKNKPKQKTEIGFHGKLDQTANNQITANGNIYFEHPRVKKLRVNGEFGANADKMDVISKLELDIFKNPNDKIIVAVSFGNTDASGKGFNITSNVKIVSKGLGLNLQYNEHFGLSFEQRLFTMGNELTMPIDGFRFGMNAFVNEQSAELIVITFGEEILKSSANYDLKKQDFKTATSLKFLGSEKITQTASINGLTQGTFTISKRPVFNVNSGYTIGKDIYLVVKGSNKEIFDGKISLDKGHFLNSNYHINDVEMKEFTSNLQKDLMNDLKNGETYMKDKLGKLQSFYEQKLNTITKASPNFDRLENEYREELNKLLNELQADPSMKKFIDQLSAIISELAKTYNTILEAVEKQMSIVENAIREYSIVAIEAFNEQILPQLQKLFDAVQKLVSELYEQTLKLLSAVFERIAKALKSFEGDFNKISKVLKDTTAGIYEGMEQYSKEICQELKDLFELLKQQFLSLPGVEYIKETYAELVGEFAPLETLKLVLAELLSSLAHAVPDEAKPFFEKFSDYVQKKMNGEDIDDMTVLKEIYKVFIDALLGFKKQFIDGFSTSSLTTTINFDMFKRLPPFVTNVRFSALNQLLSEPIFNLHDLVYLYRPYAFNPIEFIPPFTLHAEISDGSHIFTFDGRHLTFPGTCSYILSRDFVDGNFSIVANMDNGKLQSISLTDKSGFMDVNKDSVLQSSGKNVEFPYHQKTLHAWRDYYTVSLLTKYGAQVQCTEDLTTCHVSVSGFYSGKTRGLLGNGNNEPYDDYLLPNGKITKSTSELGNAYRTRTDCAAVTTSGDDHSKSHSNDFCSQYFGRDSSLRMCFLFVKPANYREACEHATHGAEDKQKAACNIVTTYASRCRQEHIPISIPKACSRCSVGKNSLDVGDEVAVKSPQNKADIVIVFDTNLNKQLVVVEEVVNELRKEMRNVGVTDVQFAAIGYNANDIYVHQYTTNGKLNYKGNFVNKKSTGPTKEEPLKTGQNELDAALVELEKVAEQASQDLSVSPDARAFQRAMKFPFRPTASKTIIAFRANGIPYSTNPSKLVAAEISSAATYERGIGVHAVMPVDIIEPADKKEKIVGFNNNVAVLVKEKTRASMGSVDVASKLKYEPDMGVDLTRKHGYVFNLKNYQTDKKRFVTLAGYILADAITRTEVESECKCVLANGLFAETRCKAKQQRLLPQVSHV